jgi:hypothetical protein
VTVLEPEPAGVNIGRPSSSRGCRILKSTPRLASHASLPFYSSSPHKTSRSDYHVPPPPRRYPPAAERNSTPEHYILLNIAPISPSPDLPPPPPAPRHAQAVVCAPVSRAAHKLAAAAVLLATLAGTAHEARRALAARAIAQNNEPGFRFAFRLTPDDPAAARGLGLALTPVDPAAAERLFERAVTLNRYQAGAWIELGLAAEARRDLNTAQRHLLEAAAVNRRYLPRWTLAGYYFRQGDAENFWRWARLAAAFAYSDPAPLYRLCWRMAPERHTTLDRAVPPTREGRAAYLAFVLAEGQPADIAPAAAALLATAGPADTPLLQASCERLLQVGRDEPALDIWNALARRAWIRAAALQPAAGAIVSNPDFSQPISGRGYDWRRGDAALAGITMAVAPGGGLRIRFDGTQAEAAPVLMQRLTLPGSSRCRLAARYRIEDGLAEASGLRWQLSRLPEGAPVAADTGLLASTEPLAAEGLLQVEFSTADPSSPAAGSLPAQLALHYRRPEGRVRWEGSVTLLSVTIEVLRSP